MSPRYAAAGKSNGVQRAWVDGKLVLDRNDIRYRDSEGSLIEKFMLHNYHGGKGPRFEPPQDQSIWCALLCWFWPVWVHAAPA